MIPETVADEIIPVVHVDFETLLVTITRSCAQRAGVHAAVVHSAYVDLHNVNGAGLGDDVTASVASRPHPENQPFENHERLTLIESLAVFPSPPVNVAVHFPRASGTTLYEAAPSPLRIEVSVAIPAQPLTANVPP